MPKTLKESIVFTIICAWIMVYFMTLYNIVIAEGNFTNSTFLIALKSMWIDYVIIGLFSFLVASRIAPKLAFRIARPDDRPIVIIFCVQIFMIIQMVAFASIIGVYHTYGFTRNFIPDYLTTYCRNFIMAFPVQMVIAGPVTRFLFRRIFKQG